MNVRAMERPCRKCGESFAPKDYQIKKRDWLCVKCQRVRGRDFYQRHLENCRTRKREWARAHEISPEQRERNRARDRERFYSDPNRRARAAAAWTEFKKRWAPELLKASQKRSNRIRYTKHREAIKAASWLFRIRRMFAGETPSPEILEMLATLRDVRIMTGNKKFGTGSLTS